MPKDKKPYKRPKAGEKGKKPKPIHGVAVTKKKTAAKKKKRTRVEPFKKPAPVLTKKDIEGAKGALKKIKRKRP